MVSIWSTAAWADLIESEASVGGRSTKTLIVRIAEANVDRGIVVLFIALGTSATCLGLFEILEEAVKLFRWQRVLGS